LIKTYSSTFARGDAFSLKKLAVPFKHQLLDFFLGFSAVDCVLKFFLDIPDARSVDLGHSTTEFVTPRSPLITPFIKPRD